MDGWGMGGCVSFRGVCSMDGWEMMCVSFSCVCSMDGWGRCVCVCAYEMVENMCCGDVCSGTRRR